MFKGMFAMRLLFAVLIAITGPVVADGARIAVVAQAAHAAASASAIAARSPHILIFDASGTMVESHPNPAAENPGGAGPALARCLAEKKVSTLIAGDFDVKLKPALEVRNIRAVSASGPAAQAAREAR